MAASTGIVLASGGITLANLFLFDSQPKADPWNEAAKVFVATGVVAGTLAVLERPAPDLAVMMGWAIFFGMMITRLNPDVPSPTERFIDWWETANK
jgi:hypothetical protein